MSLLLSSRIRDISLADLPGLVAQLVDQVVASGFQPDCVVFLERAGRLLAVEMCRRFSVGGVPLSIRRRGGEAKGRLALLLAFCPRWTKDLLRQLEARLLWQRLKHERAIGDPPTVNFASCRVLVLDDAVDTGTSVQMARAWGTRQGALPEDVKVAAITVTTWLAQDAVDFTVYRQICRFPWSADSRERARYQRAYAAAVVPGFVGNPAAC